ncbi:MAG: type II toxin-antitoxin system Phd/YefM family antitoxin [Firmicutes bacterium]|nr:type II toxin-antitoxin system Phd/YefM family antitoxin [Bacillota bacterium]
MHNVNVSNFRKDLFAYINQTIEYGEPINVSAKNGNAVLLSEEEYNGMIETLYLCSIPGMRDSIIEGMNTKPEDLVEVDWEKEL